MAGSVLHVINRNQIQKMAGSVLHVINRNQIQKMAGSVLHVINRNQIQKMARAITLLLLLRLLLLLLLLLLKRTRERTRRVKIQILWILVVAHTKVNPVSFFPQSQQSRIFTVSSIFRHFHRFRNLASAGDERGMTNPKGSHKGESKKGVKKGMTLAQFQAFSVGAVSGIFSLQPLKYVLGTNCSAKKAKPCRVSIFLRFRRKNPAKSASRPYSSTSIFDFDFGLVCFAFVDWLVGW